MKAIARDRGTGFVLDSPTWGANPDWGEKLPALRLFGGCCGTDHRHVAAICAACLPQPVPGA